MKQLYHPKLAKRWSSYSLAEQMANIGSEVERTISWRDRDAEYSRHAFWRALELLDFTLVDKRYRHSMRLKEIARVREVLVDYFAGDNIYRSTDELWRGYFMFYTYTAAVAAGR